MLKKLTLLILLFVNSKTFAEVVTIPDSLSEPLTHLDSILLLSQKYSFDSLESQIFTSDFSKKPVSVFFENRNAALAWKAGFSDDSLRIQYKFLLKTGNYLGRNPNKFNFLKNEIATTEKEKRPLFIERFWWADSLKYTCDPLNNSSGFKTSGITPSEVKKRIIEEMKAEAAAPQFVESIINSGSSFPEKIEVNSGYSLYKIVPKGGPSPSLFTPFWAKLEELTKYVNNDLEQKFGLPVTSHSAKYDVYKIELKEGKMANIFESVVASTTENGYNTTGGAIQSLVLDRSKWTFPTLVPNIEIFPTNKR